MSTIRVKVSFSTYTDSGLYQKAEHILQNMTGNPNFASPTPTLTVLQTAITKYSNALGKVVDGTKQDTALKNQARQELESLLHDLGLFVQLNGQNNGAILAGSGFDISKTPAPVGILAKPDGFSADVNQAKGCIDLWLNSINGARSYLYEYTETPVIATSVWRVQSDTATSVTVSNLESGKEYAFRVCGVGSDPTRVYSDIATKVAPF